MYIYIYRVWGLGFRALGLSGVGLRVWGFGLSGLRFRALGFREDRAPGPR